MSTAGLHYRPLWLAVGILMIGFTIWFSLQGLPPAWAYAWGDKPLHAGVYAALVFWFGQIYRGIPRQLAVVAAFVAMGLMLEWLQAWLTSIRQFDETDMLANAAGALAAWILLRTPAGHCLRFIDRHLAGWRGRT